MNSKVEIMFKPLRQPFGYKYIMAILLNIVPIITRAPINVYHNLQQTLSDGHSRYMTSVHRK